MNNHNFKGVRVVQGVGGNGAKYFLFCAAYIFNS